jgi:RND family efflux transporter MFP subunit
MKKKTKIVAIILCFSALTGFAGWRIWQAYQKKAAVETAAAARTKGGAGRLITVSIARARTAPVRQDIEITGSLKPKEQVDVTSKVTGRVQRITVQVGDFVRQGQLIAELEDLEIAQQVRRAEAAREVVRATEQQRKAELANAKADADRAKQLFDQGLLSRQEYEAKTTSYRVFQAQVALVAAQEEQAAAELRELTIQRAQMKIHAPISGFVAQKFVDTGAVVSPSTPIARVVNLSTMVTVANVPEREVARLRLGNRATVTFDAFGQQEFTGTVARIAPVLDAATRSALVEVEISNPQGALKAEMFARVRLDVGQMREAILIPRDALVYRGQQAGVFVVDSTKPVFQSVDTGATHGPEVEVVANLEPGTTIVSRGAAMLQEGDQIRVVESKEAELDNKTDNSTDGAAHSPAAKTGAAG